jgi:hypothetical protein
LAPSKSGKFLVTLGRSPNRSGTIFARRASCLSGTLHLTYFIDYNDFLAGATAAEEIFRVENCCHRIGFPWLIILQSPDVGTI